jgi:hypothetical protein
VFAEAISFLNPWSNVNLSGVIESWHDIGLNNKAKCTKEQ